MLVMVSVKHSEPPSLEEELIEGFLYKPICDCCATVFRAGVGSLYLGKNSYGCCAGDRLRYNPRTVVTLTQE